MTINIIVEDEQTKNKKKIRNNGMITLVSSRFLFNNNF